MRPGRGNRLTAEGRQRLKEAATAAAAERRARTRYYIAFNYRPGQPYRTPLGTVAYRKGVWPILFMSRDLAVAYLAAHPIFANSERQADRPRIVSASVEKVLLRKAGE